MIAADLVRMANQIAEFNRPYGFEAAVSATEAHIRDFWDPRMRAGLAQHLGAGGEGLTDIAREGAARVCLPRAA